MGITRKRLIAGAASSISVFGIVRSRAKAAEFKYKLGHDQPAEHPQNLRAVEAAKKVTEESGGRLVVDVYPNSQLGGDTQMLAQLRSGALEMYQCPHLILSNILPVASLAAVPFAFKDYTQLWTALDGALGAYIHAETEKLGIHPLENGWDGGFRDIFTSNRPIKTPADMKGMKLRIPVVKIVQAFVIALGASPTPINSNEVFSALQAHLVDGAEGPLVTIESSKYYEATKYVSITNHQPTPFEMLINGAAWQRLPKDLREIMSRNFNAYSKLNRKDIATGEITLQEKLKGQGQSFVTPDNEAFRAVIRQAGLYEKWRDEYGAKPFALLEQVVGKLA
ncbi:MAG: TRAP transporter substrate-binding protein [Vulcanimicrobiaceae bacterium]